MFFIIEEAKETILDLSQGTVKVLWILLLDLLNYVFHNFICSNIISI